jgi:hypothetical protein
MSDETLIRMVCFVMGAICTVLAMVMTPEPGDE